MKKNSEAKNELKIKALELERKNQEIEEMAKEEGRDRAINQADGFNEELNRLEKLTGASEEEIMREYKNLTEAMAEKGVAALLEELESLTSVEEKLLKAEVNGGNFDRFLAIVEKSIPGRLVFATACILMFSTATWAADTQAKGSNTQEQYAFQQAEVTAPATFTNEESQKQEVINEELTEKYRAIVEETDRETKKIVDNIDGLIKALAQKKVFDEIADKYQEIVDYLINDSQEPPKLETQAIELLVLYKNAVKKVDELGEEKASKEIRDWLQERMRLIETKDYRAIKQAWENFSVKNQE